MKIIYFFKIPAEIIIFFGFVAIFVLYSALGIIELILTIIFFFFFLGFCFGVIYLLLIMFTKDHFGADIEGVLTALGLIILCALPALMFTYKMYDRIVLANEIIVESVELKIDHPKKAVQSLKNLPMTERQNGTFIRRGRWDKEESCIECTRGTGGYLKIYLGKKYKYFSVDAFSTDDFSVYADDILIECSEELTDNDEEHDNKKFFVINKCEYLKIKIDDELDLDNACVYKAKYKRISKKKKL
ncbi:MAG: hypothetical protein HFH72_09895 [Lachnospiraceae bacterium]|nr:hypothetical protein [Lachnospiraceae bacterium]